MFKLTDCEENNPQAYVKIFRGLFIEHNAGIGQKDRFRVDTNYPAMDQPPAIAGALVASVVAVLAAATPLKLGLVIAVIAGISAAVAADILLERLRRQ